MKQMNKIIKSIEQFWHFYLMKHSALPGLIVPSILWWSVFHGNTLSRLSTDCGPQNHLSTFISECCCPVHNSPLSISIRFILTMYSVLFHAEK